jgi:hypothetical protein
LEFTELLSNQETLAEQVGQTFGRNWTVSDELSEKRVLEKKDDSMGESKQLSIACGTMKEDPNGLEAAKDNEFMSTSSIVTTLGWLGSILVIFLSIIVGTKFSRKPE